ncbi:MAG: BMC domain-containing protein [Candidatus Marinimicrobia bacterium]|nr:BMC domain-containing protein [Candidatus Neomarinimicrobiota bacterium]
MKYPAIAIIEFKHIPAGIFTSDAMVKKAPVTVLRSGTVHNGKYIVMLGGSVASVEESYHEGLARGEGSIIDQLFLPAVHAQVHEAILGSRLPITSESLGIIETSTLSAVVKGADKALKGTDVSLVELRLADDIGGKGLAIFCGKIEEVSTAIELARSVVEPLTNWLSETLIPRLSGEILKQIEHSTSFSDSKLQLLQGGEI